MARRIAIPRRRADLEDGPDVGIESGAPLGSEAVGDLAEDDAGAERLLGAVVGGRDGAIGDEDKEVLAETLDDAEQFFVRLGCGHDLEWIVEFGLETGVVVEPCGGTGNGGFEIFCEASASAEPGEGSLHHPAAWQEFEPAGGVGALDDLYGPFADFGETSIEFGTGIAAGSEYMPQPGIQGFDGFEHVGRPIPILYAGMMNDGADEVADCIRDDVALAPLDLLSGIEPTRPAGFGGLDRLTVDHTGCGRRPASGHFPRLHDQDVIDTIEGAIATEAVEIALHGGERCEFLRDLPPPAAFHLLRRRNVEPPPPLAAGRQHVENGLHNPPQRHRSRPTSMRQWGHERLDQGPFGIGKVACVAQSGPAISLPSDFSPGHRRLRPSSQTN